MEKLIFDKISKVDVFDETFMEFSINNEITFEESNLAIVYAPNGGGKTSIARVFSEEKNTSYLCNKKDKDIFHVIFDQIKRNIIEGSSNDYIVSEDIKKEYDLKNEIKQIYIKLSEDICKIVKDDYLLKKKSANFFVYIKEKEQDFYNYITPFANVQDKGLKSYLKDAKISELINHINHSDVELTSDHIYILEDFEKKGYIYNLAQIYENIVDINFHGKEIIEYEKPDDVMNIVEKYFDEEECIICENENYDSKEIIERSKRLKDDIYSLLNDETKNFLNDVYKKIPLDDDVFDLRSALKEFFNGNIDDLALIMDTANNLILEIVYSLEGKIWEIIENSNIEERLEEYNSVKNKELKFTEEDEFLFEEIINSHINKPLVLKRNENDEIVINIGNQEVFGTEREDFQLSTGEQNFISLGFEMLRARQCENKIIVIDDPVSSFDSIYKNKIVFLISKLLEDKQCILLTHNKEMLSTCHYQIKDNPSLYLLNNIKNGDNNGFIKVSSDDSKMLFSTIDLLNNFRREDFLKENFNKENIENFLIGVLPFLRSYSSLIDDKECKDCLNKVMHGYSEDSCNISEVYKKLLGIDITSIFESEDVIITVEDIIDTSKQISVKDLGLEELTLLQRSMYTSIKFLCLRLSVEKILVNKYSVPKSCDQLSSIINKALKDDSNNRVFFMSRKTLLNEFNHFDANFNIYQPAIDISLEMLDKESVEIMERLERISTS